MNQNKFNFVRFGDDNVNFLTVENVAVHYDPDQPRKSKGDPEGGQWTSEIWGTIERAIKEQPSRISHGNTAKNAFTVTGKGEIISQSDLNLDLLDEESIIFHSHSAENWKEILKSGRKEGFQPHTADDVMYLINRFKNGQGNRSVVFMAGGEAEMLFIPKNNKNADLWKLTTRKIAKQIESSYDEIEKSGKSTYEYERDKLIKFTKKYGIDYKLLPINKKLINYHNAILDFMEIAKE